MSYRLLTFLCASLLLLPAACGPGGGRHDADAGVDALPSLPDRDGDNIADEHEGCAQGRDSDSDGTADCDDMDSDGDGIKDIDEAGDAETYTPPRDADGDSTPDYLDLDSDDNAIQDAAEGKNDLDSDGIGDFADLDNDGDNLLDTLEIGNDAALPRDSDSDGVPDLWDFDSDDDNISDLHEVADDPDQDSIPSYLDLDSDGDCISDEDEAGDAALSTPPRDADNDTRHDFKDRDKDNDGLADYTEDANCNGVVDQGETSATNIDTDSDGVSDLIEVAAGTNPNNSTDNPQANGDFVFIVPYEKPTDPAEDDLDFKTNLQTVDVYALVDRSGSMSTEIDSIRTNIQTVANTVTCGGAQSDPNNCIPDIWWGVGTVGYRGTNGESYTNHLDLQSQPTAITNALPTTEPAGCCAEPLYLATWSAITGGAPSGAGCSVTTAYSARTSCQNSPAGSGGIGYPCFRPNALPVILLTTDEAPSQTYACPAVSTVTNAANNISAKIVGVIGATTNAQVRPDLEELAMMTGAVDASNNNVPLVVNGSDANAATAIATAIRTLARGVPLDISASAVDDPSDTVNAVSRFIGRLETQQLGTAKCTGGLTDEDSNSDGYPDAYVNVLPGTPVCWRLLPKMNTTIPPTEEPQLFKATIDVYGDGVTLLDSRDVFFLVPPAPVDIPVE